MKVIQGYIDRIENNSFVIISEEYKKEFVFETDIEETNLKVNDWLLISLNEKDDIIDITKDEEVTRQRIERLKILKNKLKRRD